MSDPVNAVQASLAWRNREVLAWADAVTLRGLRSLAFLDPVTRADTEREIARRFEGNMSAPAPPLER